ncbi:MAG: hypothetical protein NWR47_06135 [Aestuariivirgaceae bacterium]|nr:hypothetical protein [Aestuariivirgaceae bacterium]
MKTPKKPVRPSPKTPVAPATLLRKGAFFRALPDDGYIRMQPDGSGGLIPIWPNCMVFPEDLSLALAKRVNMVWFPPGHGVALNAAPWIINSSGDADEYEVALTWLSRLHAARRVPILNHPDAVLASRRDRISQTLQDIPGLTVPKCVRFKPLSPEDFVAAFEDGQFRYPVLVRPVGSQTGRSLVKINGPESWGEIHTIPWGGSHVFMTQYVDFAGADGAYTKMRIACVGKDHVLRHVKFSDGWLVHNTSTSGTKVSEEMRILDEVAASEPLAQVIEAIKSRVRLDFWGIDVGYQGPGKPLVFFEANAAMSIVRRGLNEKPRETPTSPDGVRKAAIQETVRALLIQHLDAPHAWISGKPAADSVSQFKI